MRSKFLLPILVAIALIFGQYTAGAQAFGLQNVTLTPADDATDVSPAQNLILEFNSDVQIGSGKITVWGPGGVRTDIMGGGNEVSLNNRTVTVELNDVLGFDQSYYVTIESGFVEEQNTGAWNVIYIPENDETSWNFATTNTVPTPQNLSPGDPVTRENDIDLLPTFDWDEVPGATGYDFELYEWDPNAQTLTLILQKGNLSTDEFTPEEALDQATSYDWRVRARGGANGTLTSQYSQNQKIRTVNNVPTPSGLVPANGATGQRVTYITFDWNTVSGADYQIELYRNTNLSTPIYSATVTDSELEYAKYKEWAQNRNLLLNNAYSWRVRARINQVWGNWTSLQSFTTFQTVPVPTNLTPGTTTAPFPTGIDPKPTLDWDGSELVDEYRVQHYVDSWVTAPLVSESELTPANSFGLAKTVTWRVQAIAGPYTSNYTSQYKFVTDFTVPKLGNLSPGNPSLANKETDIVPNPTLTWDEFAAADSYDIWVRKFDGGQYVDVAWATQNTPLSVNDNEYIIPAGRTLDFNGDYLWNVRAIAGNKTGPWSDGEYFKVKVALEAPQSLNPGTVQPTAPASIYGLLPTLDWADLANATSYEVQLQEIDETPVDQGTVTESEFVPANNLELNTSYRWRVRGKIEQNNGVWSAWYRFITPATLPKAVSTSPGNNDPFNPESGIVLNPTFNWNEFSGTKRYEIKIFEFNGTWNEFKNLNSGIIGSPFRLPNADKLSLSNQYYWQVRIVVDDGQGGDVFGAWSNPRFFNSVSFIPQPTNLTPGTVSPAAPTPNISLNAPLAWTGVDNAYFYQFQVYTWDGNNVVPVTNWLIANDANYTVTEDMNGDPLKVGQTYYWRIRAYAGAFSSLTPLYRFQTRLNMPTPSGMTPADLATNIPLNVVLDWNDTPGATGYDLQFGTWSGGFQQIESDTDFESSEYDPTNALNNNILYFWRIRARGEDKDGQTIMSSWTPLGTYSRFRTVSGAKQDLPQTGGEQPVTQISYDVNVYPNPATEYLNINADFGQSSLREVRLVSIDGRVAFSVNRSVQGLYTETINVTDLIQGAYLLQFRLQSGEIVTERVIIQ
jgi:hypothetical protein